MARNENLNRICEMGLVVVLLVALISFFYNNEEKSGKHVLFVIDIDDFKKYKR